MNFFVQYDTDKDGFLSGQESVTIFSKSGLGVDVLKKIWKLADNDADNRLTSKEFCIAFHLIVCVGKQGFELPPILPPILRSFLENAPESPGVMQVTEGEEASESTSSAKDASKGLEATQTALESKFSALPVPKNSLLTRSSPPVSTTSRTRPPQTRDKSVGKAVIPADTVNGVKSAITDLHSSIKDRVGQILTQVNPLWNLS